MRLAEKGISKLKEENLTEAAIDFVETGAKQKRTKGREEKKEPRANQGAKKESSFFNRSNPSKNNYTNKRSHYKTNNIVCFRCKHVHLVSSCILQSVKCKKCGGFGHLQKIYKKKGQMNMLEEICQVHEQEHLEHRAKFTVFLRIENQDVMFDVNCGSADTLDAFQVRIHDKRDSFLPIIIVETQPLVVLAR
ncbi:uncharacterized protein LOC105428599 [Pogonomyrmex barbatus]|uniref:Uncharacterized protein LOC105428599 n=1 Tax=Pogonomyrmex barbatus TaxID=144034 RepID=A0A6I9WB54_9HYME|nr:uncharacterized protein LOC105428599 [Pogonomyrmex barbatus]